MKAFIAFLLLLVSSQGFTMVQSPPIQKHHPADASYSKSSCQQYMLTNSNNKSDSSRENNTSSILYRFRRKVREVVGLSSRPERRLCTVSLDVSNKNRSMSKRFMSQVSLGLMLMTSYSSAARANSEVTLEQPITAGATVATSPSDGIIGESSGSSDATASDMKREEIEKQLALLEDFDDDGFENMRSNTMGKKKTGSRGRRGRKKALSKTDRASQLVMKQMTTRIVPIIGVLLAGKAITQSIAESKLLAENLKIYEQERAEYFNITNSTASDDELADSLKSEASKKNITSVAPEEDENEDSKSPPKKPKFPKEPSGGEGSTPKSPGGNDNSSTGPSQEDIDRLNKLLGKS